jgi:cytochrome c oxidase cbb3-type subunit 1
MTAHLSAATPPIAPEGVEPDPIDASCRVPLVVFFTGAALWIVLASLLDLVASVKFHAPGFLADCSWLTYGRVHAAAVNALLYGFALPAGFGVALRIVAKLGRTRVSQPWLIAAGGKVWNLGVLVGVIAILSGDSTGFENLEMPHYAALLLFLSFLLVGLGTALTLHRRRESRLSAPQWFLLTALFWFPWIYSTANLLLLVFPIRGVQQSVLAWWYSSNLTVVWLSLVGLATAFCFLGIDTDPVSPGSNTESDAPPRVPAGQPVLHGTATAEGGQRGAAASVGKDYRPLFVFWTLILFGSWVGIPGGAPVPAWMPTLSTIATVLLIVPLLTVAVIIYGSARPHAEVVRPGSPSASASNPDLRFIQFGSAAWLIAGVMRIVGALPGASPFIHFTWFTVAQLQLNVYGFFAMTMFGAIYCIVPSVAGVPWPWPKVGRAHFWCLAAGVVLLIIPLGIGGIIQGIQLNQPQHAFMELTKTTLVFLRVSTVGNALILLGNALLAGNLLRLLARYVRLHFVPLYRSATAGSRPAGSAAFDRTGESARGV